MPYYMNVFPEDFGTELLLDPGLRFMLKGNPNRPDLMAAWNPEPYDLSSKNLFAISYSFDRGRSWGTSVVALTAAGGRTAQQVADELNADAGFAGVFLAYSEIGPNARNVVKIKRNGRVFDNFRAYVPNTGSGSNAAASAERVLQFNAKCDVQALPSTFDVYTVAYKKANPDSDYDPRFVTVDPAIESYVLTNRGLPLGTKADWEMLKGRSERFTFKKTTTDSANGNRVLEEIEYSAGAVAGDLGRRTVYTYNSGNTTANANRVVQLPWQLLSTDLVFPPAEVGMTGGLRVSGAAAVTHS
jgi:hypothetical protein